MIFNIPFWLQIKISIHISIKSISLSMFSDLEPSGGDFWPLISDRLVSLFLTKLSFCSWNPPNPLKSQVVTVNISMFMHLYWKETACLCVFMGKISMFDVIFSWETDHCTGKWFVVLNKSPPQLSSAGLSDRYHSAATTSIPSGPRARSPREFSGDCWISWDFWGIWWANGI